MARLDTEREESVAAKWIRTPVGRLIKEKHALAIMILAYENGTIGTRALIRLIRGHPAAIIRTIRFLEKIGILNRVRTARSHHTLQTHLTVKGMQLVETPVYRWVRLIRKWDRLVIP